MIQFLPTLFMDREQIQKWISADPWHGKDDPSWWLSGGHVHFKILDGEGTVFYVRFDQDENTLLRLHTQFAPLNEVSEKRVAIAVVQSMKGFIPHARTNGATGIVTESKSPKLVAFLQKNLNFVHYRGDDYLLMFSEGQ